MTTANRPEVSIIIVNYNTFELTCNCVQSVYKKTQEVSFEIIIVDNSSNECDVDLFKVRFPEINLIKSKTNLGFAKGNNLGISFAKGNIILLLNSDSVLVNDAISICFERLNNERNVGVISCKLIFPDGKIQKQCRRFNRISLLLIEKLRIHKFLSKRKRATLLLNGYFDHETIAYPERLWGTFFMFKKVILQKFPKNKLADRFFMYGEDNEWCYQLRKHTGLKIMYYPEAVIIHYLGGSRFGNSITSEKLNAIRDNNNQIMVDYYGKIKTWVYNTINV